MQERIGLIFAGAVLGLFGGAMIPAGLETNFFTDETSTTPLFWIGLALAIVGGVLLQIGVIAVGVALGLREPAPAAE